MPIPGLPVRGAAVIVIVDRPHDRVLSWMTHGDAGRDDVTLSHDSWGSENAVFPPGSFITIPQLRHVVLHWAFADAQPPPVVSWVDAPNVGWF